jgi:hypothetical protein
MYNNHQTLERVQQTMASLFNRFQPAKKLLKGRKQVLNKRRGLLGNHACNSTSIFAHRSL